VVGTELSKAALAQRYRLIGEALLQIAVMAASYSHEGKLPRIMVNVGVYGFP
jgi:hypothetical protein